MAVERMRACENVGELARELGGKTKMPLQVARETRSDCRRPAWSMARRIMRRRRSRPKWRAILRRREGEAYASLRREPKQFEAERQD